VALLRGAAADANLASSAAAAGAVGSVSAGAGPSSGGVSDRAEEWQGASADEGGDSLLSVRYTDDVAVKRSSTVSWPGLDISAGSS
jgi:hypothetical protein